MKGAPLLLDSITDVAPHHAGQIAVSGSHGGLYPAAIASRAGLRAVILNDAGKGLDGAGIAGIMALDRVGMAAAAADCMSCEIGSARDMMERGRIGTANATAMALGVTPGMSVADAAARLADAVNPAAVLPPVEEAARTETIGPHRHIVRLLDSASLVGPGDAGGIVVTGSHGGLIGGDPARALKAQARVAVFNDAGGGRNGIGFTRLPALDARGVAAVTVAHDSARIGEAASALATGRISACNRLAAALGAEVGLPLRDWIAGLPPVATD
ncbi:hypothetical protein N8I71_01195 [Roseibacterium sp. SDUM158016]|uniref:hypothetical protein n=1 Tax=Roseicyclus sediminis TaxID=2980997 RepID=UPI0021D3B035|nr:hypothetical protein [Roseibacterium sp. SDUM158016]MCU4651433.1 hypothetical protein [Roseibacterium sp. SDUM158016]